MSKIVITRKDVVWGYVAQFCNIGANILILPAIFRFLPSEILGIWYVFINLGMLATLIGVVFQTTFSRNIAYAFGGATSLLREGVDAEAEVLDSSNYPLIKSLIRAMHRFYSYVSVAMALLLFTLGTVYIYYLTRDFADSQTVLLAWILYASSVVVGFYCIHFSSILQGRGYIQEYNQLVIINRLVYMSLSYFLLFSGYGILGVVIANCASGIVNLVVGQYLAFKDHLRQVLRSTVASSTDVMSIIWKNTYRQGLANLAMYLSTKGCLFYASLFLPLATIARYGLSLQVVNVLTTISLLYYASYSPYIAQSWVTKDFRNIRRIYTKSLVLMLLLYVSGSVAVLLLGDWGLNLIGSGTSLLPTYPLALLFLVYLLDSNQSLAIQLISSENKVPYLAASLISGVAIFILIPLFIKGFDWHIYGLILAVGFVQLCYQNWKWVNVVSKEIKLNYLQQISLGVRYWLTKDKAKR